MRMLWCRPTFCAPTSRSIVRYRLTANSFGPSRCWPALTRTPRGGAPSPSKSSVPAARVLPRIRRTRLPIRAQPIASTDARAVLAIAPTPTDRAKLTRARISAALRRGGRQRNIEPATDALHPVLRQPQLRQPPSVEHALGQQALALLAMVNAACDGVEQLCETTATAFRQYPDYRILTSFPGLGELTGARVLAEIGDDRTRSPMPVHRARMPVPRRSLAPPGEVTSPRTDASKTTGWPAPVSIGHSWRSPTPVLHERITTGVAPMSTAIRRPAEPLQSLPWSALPLSRHRPNLRPRHGLRHV